MSFGRSIIADKSPSRIKVSQQKNNEFRTMSSEFSKQKVIFLSRHMSQSALTEKESMEIGTKIATEAITNIKTVASLSKDTFIN